MVNPSPYMIYLQARGSILVASSPEILCHVSEDRKVTNRSALIQQTAAYRNPALPPSAGSWGQMHNISEVVLGSLAHWLPEWGTYQPRAT